jgi:hypothetical protein
MDILTTIQVPASLSRGHADVEYKTGASGENKCPISAISLPIPQVSPKSMV